VKSIMAGIMGTSRKLMAITVQGQHSEGQCEYLGFSVQSNNKLTFGGHRQAYMICNTKEQADSKVVEAN